MGLFRASAPTSVQVSDAGTPLRVTAAATGKPWSLWADGLGTFAIRALQILLEAFEGAPLPVQVVHHEGRRATRKVRAFIDLAVDTLRADPALN